MDTETDIPAIYVACLASYNAGILHGRWIDATQSSEDIFVEIQAMLATSPIKGAEEYAIHDTQAFCGITISESEDLDTVSQIAQFIDEQGELGAQVYNYVGKDIDRAESMMEDAYKGVYDSEVDFAAELADDTMQIPEPILPYFDYEAFTKDTFINDYVSFEVNGYTHVFSMD